MQAPDRQTSQTGDPGCGAPLSMEPPGAMRHPADRTIAAWAYGCYAWLLLAIIVPVFGGMGMLAHRPPWSRRVVRVGARLLFRLAGVPLTAKGLDRLPNRPHVLLINHASHLDAIALTALLPVSPGYAFTTRQQFRSQLLLYPLVRSIGTIVMLPPEARHGKSNVDRLTAALRRGERLVIFPEGAFVPENELLHFHSGAFTAAANAPTPIVVAGLRGTRLALRLGTWLPRRVPISLEIGPVLTPSGNDPAMIDRLSDAAREAMLALSGEADAESR